MTEYLIALMPISFLSLSIWYLICNEKTYKSKTKLNDRIFASKRGEDYWEYSGLRDRVSYKQHLIALFLFRNPWKLYDPKIRELMEKDYERY